MKFEVGKKYYGISIGAEASWREITILAIVGESPERSAAVLLRNRDGEDEVLVWDEARSSGRLLFDGFFDEFYSETPQTVEFGPGDHITFSWQPSNVSHYLLREKFVHERPNGPAVQWISLRFYKDGTTGIAVLTGHLIEEAAPYYKK